MAGERLIRSSGEALAAGHVTLKFRDGDIAATTAPEDGEPVARPPSAAPQRRPRPDAKAGQSDLFD